jgi:hypothetical protein
LHTLAAKHDTGLSLIPLGHPGNNQKLTNAMTLWLVVNLPSGRSWLNWSPAISLWFCQDQRSQQRPIGEDLVMSLRI